MSLSFDDLRQLRELGLNYSAVLVKLYLDEHGFTPVGTIADACGVSVSSVEKALKRLKSLRLLNQQKITHDHDHSKHVDKGTEQTVTGTSVAVSNDQADDPIRSKLLAYDVLPWCVDQVMGKIESGELRQAVVQLQLDYHAYRLSSGFKFKAHPARYLFSAILKGYAPPEGYHSTRHKQQAGIISDRTPVYQAPRQVNDQEQAPATLEDKIATINRMMASPIPSVRRLANKLAQDWGISPSGPANAAV